MPGEGFAADYVADQREKAVREEQLWAQRCKLYLYRLKARNWIHIGTGKGSLSKKVGRVEFLFEDEKFHMPMARHFIDTASTLSLNAGTDRGWSWTAHDQIQQHGEEAQWFTAKFASADAADNFKDAFTALQEDPDAELPPFEAASRAESRASHAHTWQATSEHPARSQRRASPAPSSVPASPEMDYRELSREAVRVPPLAETAVKGEAWLLYFEKGTVKHGMAETSTAYVGVYGSKAQALINSVRAMDTHDDIARSWRIKSHWTRCEDRRKTIGDKGAIIAVHGADGAFNQVKIRKLPFNQDLISHDNGKDDSILFVDGERQ